MKNIYLELEINNVVSFRTRRENFEKNFDRNLKNFTKEKRTIYEKKAGRMHQDVTGNVTKLIFFSTVTSVVTYKNLEKKKNAQNQVLPEFSISKRFHNIELFCQFDKKLSKSIAKHNFF